MSAPKPCNCPKCGEHFESTKSMIRHRRTVHGLAKNVAKPYSWVCPICNQVFKTMRDRDFHRISIHGKYYFIAKSYDNPINDVNRVCKYCGTRCNSRKALRQHYLICEEKRKLPKDSLGRTYTLESKRCAAITRKQRINDGTLCIHPCSDETRKKISEAHKARFKNGLGTHWINPWMHRSYAEQYFYDILSQELDASVSWKNNFRVGRYLLDFANLNNKVYFEVDGESHYTPDGIAHDKVRTEKLASLGWYLIGRIRWKHYTLLEYTEKQKIVKNYLDAFVSPNTNIILDIPIKPSLNTKVKNTGIANARRQINIQTKERRIQEYMVKRSLAKSEGLIRSDGRISGTGIPLSEWARRKDLILTCGVDLTQFGWVEKVIKCTGLSKRMIENTLSKFHDEFDGKYFRRKWNPVETKP